MPLSGAKAKILISNWDYLFSWIVDARNLFHPLNGQKKQRFKIFDKWHFTKSKVSICYWNNNQDLNFSNCSSKLILCASISANSEEFEMELTIETAPARCKNPAASSEKITNKKLQAFIITMRVRLCTNT